MEERIHFAMNHSSCFTVIAIDPEDIAIEILVGVAHHANCAVPSVPTGNTLWKLLPFD